MAPEPHDRHCNWAPAFAGELLKYRRVLHADAAERVITAW